MNTNKNPFIKKIVWFALVFSVVIYIIVAFITTKEQIPKEVERTIVYALTVMAILSGSASLFIKPILSKVFQVDKLPGNTFIRDFMIWALAESVAVFGLALTFLTMNFQTILPFAIPSIILLVILRPVD